ncbi:hypothetical protein DCW30_13245 [Streptomyces alfalfae]|uniref:Uncharacterized protein n=1 Tax=Streptomyces alfalfae TaxID=1642299 RepID=A0ABM6H1F6_9ACTN|nr:DUF6271 family protein [Streptomyces alfalfae]AYA20028.1 hypothetical protein D3X13_30570 [Streptomyces fradiae]APY89587.1 hypothetical protein A7J05_31305 [Streptomyces alfalfae]QUI30375.1 hypothetical protein H9W91_05540 [Streptomyces alfalfae]RXX44115.1 hypothetical protein DCW30_13245 [Streptomyces alfalfae]RZN02223.1 hypothetical protein D4104_06620 [Streptomyces alfalfae]
MRRICLTLPTNRACPDTIAAIGQEAAYATAHFDVEVHLLILDSSDPATFAAHAAAVHALPEDPRVSVHHLGEPEQRAFLSRVIARADVAKPELMLELMLPAAVSYGACTNRAFLFAAALGCESVHRRDSDSRYQLLDGEPVFPVHHELASLGKSAVDAAHGAVETALAPRHLHKRVSMVGGSFVGELSVDIGEIRALDPGAYHDVVSLWAPDDWTDEQKRELVDESFRGAGSETFTDDRATLTLVDPMRVDMCNIAFHGVHERVPLPPATDTIGSDYFLIHLVHDAALPGVLHNRDIVNYYTAERRTDAGFIAYQTRFVKFFLSMLYFNFIYERMAEAGEALLDADGRVRASAISEFARQSTALDQAGNVRRLDRVDAAYRRLGGRYAHFADLLAERRERFLDEARGDIEDFALLTEAWGSLIRAAGDAGAHLTARRPA